jgi:hypothetical protein
MSDMKYSQDSIWAKRNFLGLIQEIMDSTAEMSALNDQRDRVNDWDMKKGATKALEQALQLLRRSEKKFSATNIMKLPIEQLKEMIEEEGTIAKIN